MKRVFWPGLGLSCLLLGVTVLPAKALMIAPPALPMRVAGADLVILGKVTGFGAKLIPGEMYKGDTRQMQIATIQVDQTLLGKGVKEVKVGFFPPTAVVPPKGGIRPPITRRYPTVQFTVGQEACVVLTKHPTKAGLYVAQNYFDVINKTGNANFDKETAEIRKAAKLLANPTAGLKSKDGEERFTTAALLITKYRTPKLNAKTEQVSAEESKLILEALAAADWDARRPGNFQMNPQQMFLRLGLTPKDGWTRPRDFRQMNVEAKKWIKDNAGKYRIQRYVSVEPKEVPTPEPK